MEGYWNPFDEFYKSKNFSEIKNKKEAYILGEEHGKILRELGFNLNFSPVVEIRNKVWIGRSFTFVKNIIEVKEKIENYIQGLHHEKILSTAKHYPGGSLVKNPHWLKFRARIYKEDLDLFEKAIKSGTDAIMIGHPIVYGEINSKGKPSTISSEVISFLKNEQHFQGLIITDAVTMFGLRLSYLLSFRKVYPDLIKAGNDIILDTAKFSTYPKILNRIKEIEKTIRMGIVSEKRIDQSVRKILKLKGYNVL